MTERERIEAEIESRQAFSARLRAREASAIELAQDLHLDPDEWADYADRSAAALRRELEKGEG